MKTCQFDRTQQHLNRALACCRLDLTHCHDLGVACELSRLLIGHSHLNMIQSQPKRMRHTQNCCPEMIVHHRPALVHPPYILFVVILSWRLCLYSVPDNYLLQKYYLAASQRSTQKKFKNNAVDGILIKNVQVRADTGQTARRAP